ncbi:alpha/beta hydrolase fold protein [Solidesulfovibrio carbinoliphilus subsp. oakridgensis]|uniref:Alpha/beta hydrolase fold protein n=1 Tax=Solidesulfovibrio carbinoliphilus subsp. oakridgensis TaxID=694327 RepID=G7Q621_9BACT|nr:alpha/beta fold hydrolase [Solidesulfovibrio carbinoliphilus]EHJ47037.1 alpha/beta hydrolase fold protein [Solidesulfovibrio carbinoliphilus subsp. oakridgensis]
MGNNGNEILDVVVPTRDAPVFVRARIMAGPAPAVCCLHGLGDSHLAFEDAFETRYLAGKSLIVPDMAGHGASPATGDYSMEAATGRVRAVLDHLKEYHGLRPSPLYLVGHSVGGIPAIYYCRDAAPGEVGGLILAEASITRFGSFITAHAEAARLSGRFGEWYRDFREQLVFRDYLGRFSFCRHYYASLRFCREDAFLQTVLAVRRVAKALPGKWSHAAGEALAGLTLPVIYAYGRDVAPETLTFLHEHAIEARPFPTDCHFLMQAMPGEFYGLLSEVCR